MDYIGGLSTSFSRTKSIYLTEWARSATLDMGDDDDNESENDEEEEDGNDSAGEEVRSILFHSLIYTHNIISLS